ncbi:MAG: preQ(1) synthase [Syntrophales bacterium]
MENFHYLGKKVNAPSKQLDTFPKPVNVQTVKFASDELTSVCPVTHQPDFNTVTIEFAPDKLCIESKSLKLYLWSFREEPIFAEGLANTISEDIFTAVQPFWCRITLVQNIRGGMQLSVVAEKKAVAFLREID